MLGDRLKAERGISQKQFLGAARHVGVRVDPAVPEERPVAPRLGNAGQIGELADLLGCDEADVLKVSAKKGIGIDEVLEAIVARVPAPKGDPDAPLQAMVFDSVFDSYRGAMPLVSAFIPRTISARSLAAARCPV